MESLSDRNADERSSTELERFGQLCSEVSRSASAVASSLGKLALALIAALRALPQVANAFNAPSCGGACSSAMAACRLPSPIPLVDDANEAEAQRLYRALTAYLTLNMALWSSAIFAFGWNVSHGGLTLAVWVPVGGISGFIGSLMGMLYVYTMLPAEVNVVPQQSRCTFTPEYQEASISLLAISAFCASSSGVVAWSLHNYGTLYRTRLMWLLEGGLAAAFAARTGFKAWRGCTHTGKLRLLKGGAGGCEAGCRWWPPLL